MSGFALIQAVVIGAVVAISAWHAFRKLLPQTSRRVLAAFVAGLDRPGRSKPLRRLGRWLQPAETRGGGCGSSSDGCGTCSGCAPTKPSAGTEAQPLAFRPRR
jgi:hypothetical protein